MTEDYIDFLIENKDYRNKIIHHCQDFYQVVPCKQQKYMQDWINEYKNKRSTIIRIFDQLTNLRKDLLNE